MKESQRNELNIPSGWIPVLEMHPPHFEDVICFCYGSDPSEAHQRVLYWTEAGYWSEDYNVTHWRLEADPI